MFKAATKIINKRAIHDPVLASAVLCIGELCHTLGAPAIVSLPNFMPAILSILQSDKLVGRYCHPQGENVYLSNKMCMN